MTRGLTLEEGLPHRGNKGTLGCESRAKARAACVLSVQRRRGRGIGMQGAKWHMLSSRTSRRHHGRGRPSGGRWVRSASGRHRRLRGLCTRHRMNKATATPIGASAARVKGFADLRLILGMAQDGTEFCFAMSKLTFGPIATGACLFKRTTELRLVEILVGDLLLNLGRVLLGGRWRTKRGRPRRSVHLGSRGIPLALHEGGQKLFAARGITPRGYTGLLGRGGGGGRKGEGGREPIPACCSIRSEARGKGCRVVSKGGC